AFLHAFITHRFMFRRVRFYLRAIQCDVAESDQPCCLTQLQNLQKQLAERLQVALTEVADRSEVRRIKRRSPARAGLSGLWLMQGSKSRSARCTWYRWLCRTWTRQASGSGKRKSWWTADATDAQKDRRRRLRNPLPIEKASGGTGVRTDQTGTRLPPVPVARRRESTCRVGHDLHHPQPPEAVRPRKGRRRLILVI